MDTYEALLTRRSIRRFAKDPVPPELIKKLMTAAIWAPSGSNSQPWRFFVLTGKKRDALIQTMINVSGPEAPSVTEYDEMVDNLDRVRASLPESYRKVVGIRGVNEDGQKFIRYGSIRFYQAPVAIIVATPTSMAGSAPQSIGAAVQNILLAAHAEGLATCWLGMPLVYGDAISDLLNLPSDLTLITSVALGYPYEGSSINTLVMPRREYNESVFLLE